MTLCAHSSESDNDVKYSDMQRHKMVKRERVGRTAVDCMLNLGQSMIVILQF